MRQPPKVMLGLTDRFIERRPGLDERFVQLPPWAPTRRAATHDCQAIVMNTPGFRVDLTDIHASGVYLVGAGDIATLDASATRGGFNVHRIELQGCEAQPALTRRMAQGFDLPARYAEDWPGIVAYLQRMDAIPSRGHVVLLRHARDLQQASKATLDALLDMFEDTASIWSDEGVTFFVFAQLPPSSAAV